MGPENNVIVQLLLAGKRRFLAGVTEAKAAMHSLGTTTDRTGKVMTLTTRRTWLMNQALFTMRRLAYGVTLGFIGLGVVALKWGFDFNKTMQNARVGFQGFIQGTDAINQELTDLYYLAAKSPFTFPEITMAARRLIPFTNNLQMANDVTGALSNSLSAVGAATGQYLTRASIQFTHILALGRVTGIQLNALSRDQIQLIPMLARHYHTTTANIVEMVHKGLIPAQDAVQALIEYQTTAGYAGKNFAVATQTLSGAWATFHDIVAKAMGSAESGLFTGLTDFFRDLSLAMLPLIKANRPITVLMLAEAFDKALSPKTHAIINAFYFFKGILTGTIATLYILFRVVNFILNPFGVFTKITGRSGVAMKYFGIYLGIGIGLMLAWKTALITAAIVQTIWTLVTVGARIAMLLFNIGLFLATGTVWGLSFALGESTVAMWLFNAAVLANPIVLLIASVLLLTVGLGVLYWKWQRFHDAVDRLGRWLNAHGALIALIPFVGPALANLTKIIGHWNELTHQVKTAVHWLQKADTLGGHSRSIVKQAFRNLIGLAGGGTVTSSGAFMVGERGPEVLHLPRGAAVQPLTLGAGGMGGGMFQLTITPQDVILDGRKVGEVVFKHRLDRIARR